uniref:Uncharacterized protein LOC102807271 n=1 Tax=Saccoglossus kowalevskii TaxID=10224 RepID=A0ABM0MD33_SACKO|nr:PREDICTED: uncharacterized protein LOC102807271 [Saccoglossus kowalevskii]
MADSRLDPQIFFIYDHSAMKCEEDDLKDAIIYFHPQSISEDKQCILCGQLMGMVNFIKTLTKSLPLLYKLKRMKLTTRHHEFYTLALAGNLDEPDSALRNRMDKLYSIFTFYHGSISQVLQRCGGIKKKFLAEMSQIWECYLPHANHYGLELETVFDPLPTLHLPKGCASLYLKASHMLQCCQRYPGVIACCLIHNNSVLCTQLPSTLVSRLIILKPNQSNHPSKSQETDFRLPFGVRILSVYLTESEYAQFNRQKQDVKGIRVCMDTPDVSKFRPEIQIHSDKRGFEDSSRASFNLSESSDISMPSDFESDMSVKYLRFSTTDSETPSRQSIESSMSNESPLPVDVDLRPRKKNNKLSCQCSNRDRTAADGNNRCHCRKKGLKMDFSSENLTHLIKTISGSWVQDFAKTEGGDDYTKCNGDISVADGWKVGDEKLHQGASNIGRINESPNENTFTPQRKDSWDNIEPKEMSKLKLNGMTASTPKGKQSNANNGVLLSNQVGCNDKNENAVNNMKIETLSEDTPITNVSDKENKSALDLKQENMLNYAKKDHIANGVDVITNCNEHSDVSVNTASDSKGGIKTPNGCVILLNDVNIDTVSKLVDTPVPPIHVNTHLETKVESFVHTDKGKTMEHKSIQDEITSVDRSQHLRRENENSSSETVQNEDELSSGVAEINITENTDDGNLQSKESAEKNKWKSALSQLGELEIQVNNVLERQKHTKGRARKYNYLRFDTEERTLTGNQLEPVSSSDHALCEVSQLIHEDFAMSETTTDVTLRNCFTTVYGKHTLSHETYFQPKDIIRPSRGAPSAQDPALLLEPTAHQKLQKDYNIRLL